MRTQDRQAPRPNPIHTVGVRFRDRHGFAETLRGAGIGLVADVRSWPRSRWLRDFNRKALESWLPGFGLGYIFLGEELGGRSVGDDSCFNAEGRVVYSRIEATDSFRDGIRQVLDLSRARRVALMCACRDHLRCHRGILVARHLHRVHGADVRHFVHSAKLGETTGIESHGAAEARLVRWYLDSIRCGVGSCIEPEDPLSSAADASSGTARSEDEARLSAQLNSSMPDQAYLAREQAIAYRRKPVRKA